MISNFKLKKTLLTPSTSKIESKIKIKALILLQTIQSLNYWTHFSFYKPQLHHPIHPYPNITPHTIHPIISTPFHNKNHMSSLFNRIANSFSSNTSKKLLN